jgi:hypothetical protein
MSQEERPMFLEVIVSVILRKKVYVNMCPFPNVFRYLALSILNLAGNIFLPSHLNAPLSEACEAMWSVSWLLLIVVDWSRYFRISYDRTKLPRISSKSITRTIRECSFGYTDCYVLSAWWSHSSLYPTCNVISQWHFPQSVDRFWQYH